MKKIPLTQGLFALVDDEDYELINHLKWYAAKNGKRYYAFAWLKGSDARILMHRFILGLTDSKIIVDHINGQGTDNRRDNLRICSRLQNSWNQQINDHNTSGYKGVSFRKDRGLWQARITVNNKTHSLGFFKSSYEAAVSYNLAAELFFGDFAKLNDV